MTDKNETMVHVKSHTRDGHKVQPYERSPPGKGPGVTEAGNGGFRIKIDGPVSGESARNSHDIATVKDALNRLGHYEYQPFMAEHTRAEGGWMDGQLGPAIKRFQAENELRIDCLINPDGETIAKINAIGEENDEGGDYELASDAPLSSIPEPKPKVINNQEKANIISKICEAHLADVDVGKLTNSERDQVIGAISDYCDSYIDMINKNEIGGDDFAHFKANFEAARRGSEGEKMAKEIGAAREIADYLKNTLIKGMPPKEARKDGVHDLETNRAGRDAAKSGKYKTAEEAFEAYKKQKRQKR